MNWQYKTNLDEIVYMNHAAIGVLTQEVNSILIESEIKISSKGEYTVDFDKLIHDWSAVRQNFAGLIGGDPEGVSITHNTAKGLQLVADGLSHRFEEGKNIVITNLEFTTNSYVWQKVCQRYDMELRVASFKGNFDEIGELIDKNTILVSISHVQFSNGYRADLKNISKLIHEVGGYLVVDAIQSIGAVPFDVNNLGVDFVATGSYKWMCGPMGHGFFYIKPELLDEFNSILVGWFADKHFHNQSHHELNPWEDAREYQDHLSFRFPALNKSLEILQDMDPEKIYFHNLRLQDEIISSLQDTKYKLITQLDPNNRSGIIKFDHPNAEKLVQELKSRKISVAFREGGIRISPHWHNNMEDVEYITKHLIELENL